ncbi:hypothetical protein HNP69_002881 [Chryseobacterium koreense]|nr:hypothetical protein [Chryseobacterium koreense]
MKKLLKTIVFIVGVDVLGFPAYHCHHLKYAANSKFFNAFSKN